MPKKKIGKTAHFFDQQDGLTPLEKWQFSTVWNCYFYSLERRFFVLEYHERHFPGLYCLKKKVWKMPLVDQNHGFTPLEKVEFSTVWTSCFYSLERRFFVLEYNERHFLGLYCLKKKVGKAAIFGPQPSVNPIWKMSIFRPFDLLVFIA